MNVEDMIIVSIDDHVVEPPDVFHGRVPKQYEELAPHVETDDKGVDRWLYRGNVTGMAGLNAVVSWPPEEWGLEPAGFAEMRPGAYDVHERVRDMDRNGIVASMCFPTFAGFSAGHFRHVKDEVTNAMISAYNDWQIDELAGSYPGRYIPMGVLPLWDTDACVLELERIFNVPRFDFENVSAIMVVVEAEGGRVALLVDELLGQQQVVVKNLEANYRRVDDVSGATIMGDGRVALILDVGSLVRRSRH